MKIILADITAKNHCFSVEEPVTFLEEGLGLTTDVQAEFVVSQQKDDVFRLCGNLKTEVLRSCDRCGKAVQFHIDEDFQYQLLLQEEPQLGSEYQCSDEDCELLYLIDPEVESSEILSEQLLLALPTHIICTDDCKGLCDQCGVDLNKEQCTCKEINENSPFAILKNLQKN
jgi:uncharacterized protein